MSPVVILATAAMKVAPVVRGAVKPLAAVLLRAVVLAVMLVPAFVLALLSVLFFGVGDDGSAR
jgi:hypothetical protein